MAPIPQTELARLNGEIGVARLVEAAGIKLKQSA